MVNELAIQRIRDAGINTERFSNLSIMVKVGEQIQNIYFHPAYALCRSLSALNCKSIYLCGAEEYYDEFDDDSIFSNRIIQMPGIWLSAVYASSFPLVNILVDLSNDIRSNSLSNWLGTKYRCPVVYLRWGHNWITLVPSDVFRGMSLNGDTTHESHHNPIAPLSRIMTGLAFQEIAVLTRNLNLTVPCRRTIRHQVFDFYESSIFLRLSNSDQFVIEIIGTGGIGVNLLESLAPMLSHSEIRIFDPDDVGPENLSLQTPYVSEDIGKPKAEVISRKLTGLFGKLTLRPFVMPFQARPQNLSKPTLLIICPDNFQVRKSANDFCLKNNIPFVEAGSCPHATQVKSYIPGYSACLEHRIPDLSERAAKETEATGCIQNRTLPGVNMIAGGIMATEALKILSKNELGGPSKGVITYDCRVSERFGITDILQPCSHYNN